MQRALIAIMSH